jgi:hypothetical protein
MAKKILICVVTIIALSVIALAATKPNFSGTWTMDRGRSFGLPGNMNQILTITQKDDQIEVETKLIQPGNERTVKDTYVLDGKEHEFTAQAPPNQTPPKGKRTVNWLPEDKGLMVTEVTTVETPKGPETRQVMRKWTISSTGELVIDMYIDGPQGSFEAKRIFTKS